MPATAPTVHHESRPRPTMKDVAARAGVSLKTVSRVVNGEPAIAAATARRVQEAITELGFRRNDVARSLRSRGGSQMIGLVIEDLGNPFYSGIAKGVEEEARLRGFVVVAGSSEEDAARERELVGALCARRVQGMVVVPAGKQHRYLEPEIEAGLQVVFLDRPPGGIKADTILLDNRSASRAAVETLIAEGHRRIGVLADSLKIYAIGERVRGYREALASQDLPADAELERLGHHTPEEAERAALDLIAKAAPTAIFATNNRTAIGTGRAILRARAPVELIGFDDFELADLMPMRLRVLRHDTVELGRQAARTLFARIEGDESPPQRTVLTPELVWRGLPVER